MPLLTTGFSRARRVALGLSLVALAYPLAAQPPHAHVRLVEGLQAVQFLIPEGAVEILIPRDLAVGDTLSGSVLVHTGGLPGKKREKNREKIERLGIEIGGLSRPAESTGFGPVAVCVRPPGTSLPVLSCERDDQGGGGAVQQRLRVRLRNPKDKILLEALLPVASSPDPAPASFTYLPLGKAGEPLEIRGAFDGDLSNTRVSLDGHPATVLAESPRRAVVRSPTAILGRTRLELMEGGVARSGPFRNLAVLVRFAKPVLQNGERTIVEVVVNGLEDLESELALDLVSLDPEVAQLERGPSQPLVIHPREVQGGGVYPWVGTVVGVSPAPIELEVQLDGARPWEELRVPAGR